MIVLRLIRSVVPVAELWAAKLIIDNVVTLAKTPGASLTPLWRVVAIELAIVAKLCLSVCGVTPCRPARAVMRDDPAVTGATAGGRDAAEQMYEACKIAVESRSAYSMRNCLELRHADLLAETNHQFWKDTVGY